MVSGSKESGYMVRRFGWQCLSFCVYFFPQFLLLKRPSSSFRRDAFPMSARSYVPSELLLVDIFLQGYSQCWWRRWGWWWWWWWCGCRLSNGTGWFVRCVLHHKQVLHYASMRWVLLELQLGRYGCRNSRMVVISAYLRWARNLLLMGFCLGLHSRHQIDGVLPVVPRDQLISPEKSEWEISVKKR